MLNQKKLIPIMRMSRFGMPLLICILIIGSLSACVTARPITLEQIKNANYGIVPENPKIIVKQHLDEVLIDPDSLRNFNVGSPTKAYTSGPIFTEKGYYIAKRGMFGYAVNVKYNAKNRMGGYVGNKIMIVLINNNRVLFMIDSSDFQSKVVQYVP